MALENASVLVAGGAEGGARITGAGDIGADIVGDIAVDEIIGCMGMLA